MYIYIYIYTHIYIYIYISISLLPHQKDPNTPYCAGYPSCTVYVYVFNRGIARGTTLYIFYM